MSDIHNDISNEVLFTKNPITYDEQVERIKEKGFIIDDFEACKEFLKHANYYRLLAYYLPFKKKDGNYLAGIYFKRIQRIYDFDSNLRSWLSRIIEQIEFYIRTQIAYHISFKYGPLGYMDSSIFNSHHDDLAFKEKISKCILDNNRTLVVKHHNKKYGGQFPIWVIIEFFPIGMLSYFYADLLTKDKKIIASTSFNTNIDCLESWLRCLTDLRNRCAHYSRLYYWIFSAIPKNIPNSNYTFDRKLFSQILMLKYLFPDKNKWNNVILNDLDTLINNYLPDISLKHIGFPQNWIELLKV